MVQALSDAFEEAQLGNVVGKLRALEGYLKTHIPGLEQNGVPHGAAVRRLRSQAFPELTPGLPSPAVIRSRLVSHYGVSGAVDEIGAFEAEFPLGGQLQPLHPANPAIFHTRFMHRCIEKKGNIGLPLHHIQQGRIRKRGHQLPVVQRIIMEYPQLQLLHQTSLAGIVGGAVAQIGRAVDVNPDFAAGIPAQHGTVIDKRYPHSVPRSGNSRAYAGNSAADHRNIRLDNLHSPSTSMSSLTSW
ncbi:hypothetical protein D3C75_649580 [compost metagenome]